MRRTIKHSQLKKTRPGESGSASSMPLPDPGTVNTDPARASYMKYVEIESYKHKFAKNLLFDWLVETANNNEFCQFGNISWRASRYGIIKELKFYETSDPYYFELSKGLIEPGKSPEIEYNEDDFFYKSFDKGKILFVPDITIFHKGVAMILIEVVHKNHISYEKKNKISDFYNGFGFQLLEINADYILNQITKPLQLEFDIITE